MERGGPDTFEEFVGPDTFEEFVLNRGRWAPDTRGPFPWTTRKSMSPKRSGWMGSGKRFWFVLEEQERSKSQPRSKIKEPGFSTNPRSWKRRMNEFLEGSFLAMRLRYWLRKDRYLPEQFRSAWKLREAIASWCAGGDQVCAYG